MRNAFPLSRQHDSMQCGAACLQMICRHYGRSYGVHFLSRMCGVSKVGVSLTGISRAAEQLGFDTFCCKISAGDLSNTPLPCVLHWNQNHYVVLYKIKNGRRFCVADPGKGKLCLSYQEFVSHWASIHEGDGSKGIAMFLQTTERFGSVDEPMEERPDWFGFLKGYISGYSRQFIWIFLGLLLGAVLQLVLPFLMQSIVDRGIKNSDIGFIWLVLLGEMMIVTGLTAVDFIRRKVLLHISMRINISLIGDFFRKLLKLPMSFFDTKLMGDLLQRIGDHTRVQSFLTGEVLGVLFSILSFLILGGVLFIYNSTVFMIFMAGSICYTLWNMLFLEKRKLLDYRLFEAQTINQNRTYQFVTCMQEIKLQDCGERRRKEWEETQTDLFAVKMKSLKLQQNQEAGAVFINEIKNILITVFAAMSVIDGQITLGVMLAIQYIIGQLNSPVEQLMSFLYSLQDVKISLERIGAVHSECDESVGGMLSEFHDKNRSMVLENVYFKYDRHASSNIIDGVSFEIPMGKVTAIVGVSGCGKTTLIKLLLRYYPVMSGLISVAGRDIGSYEPNWWRRQCGVVMQDGVIFTESIARNIAVDDRAIDEDRMKEAAKIACIDGYINGLPLGFDTIIGADGMVLSQGQKQRILIARAVYKNPDFLFLDEATNALDARNERDIVENLQEFFRGRTVVVVAHRLSTVSNADQIVVMDGGRVVEIGNHTTLTERRGVYYDLVRNQLELGA